MAYVDQEKKAKIAAAVKAVMPRGWKWSLAVDHRSTIVLTVASAPFDVLGAIGGVVKGHVSVNPYHVRQHVADECLADVCVALIDALNTDNFDNSDISTDYFHVGHYITLQFGRWNKPFVCTASPAAAVSF